MWYWTDAWNAALNTLCFAPRLGYTAWNKIVDKWRALLYNVLNCWTRLWDRANDIKTAVHNATHTWSNWKRIRRAPTSIIAWTASFLTWTLRDIAATSRDIVWDFFHVFWNTLNNAWTAIKRMWKKQPVWEFSFKKIQLPEEWNPKMPSILPNTLFKAAA